MCGRVFVKSSAAELVKAFAFAHASDPPGFDNQIPNYNGAPRQVLPIIIRKPDWPGGMFTSARWGFIPSWSKEPNPKLQPINAKGETVASSGMFKNAYRYRRALLPIDGFFEWKAIKAENRKQPYAIAMADGSPFAVAAIWSSRKDPETGLEEINFAVLTCPPNEKMAEIHDRMPLILHPEDYQRWLSDEEDPADLIKPFPAAMMTMWEINPRVGNVRNNDPDILKELDIDDVLENGNPEDDGLPDDSLGFRFGKEPGTDEPEGR